MPPDGTVPDGDERLQTEQRIERLHAAIARLPIEYREALVLNELQELSYAETADVRWAAPTVGQAGGVQVADTPARGRYRRKTGPSPRATSASAMRVFTAIVRIGR